MRVERTDTYDTTIQTDQYGPRASTYAWGLTQTGGIPTLTSKVGSGNGGQALILNSRSGSGASAIQKYLVQPVTNSRVVVDVTYNVGTPGSDKGGYVTIADDKSARFLTLRVDNTGELFFGNGGRLDAASVVNPVSGMTPLGAGFTAKNAWYDIHAVIDFDAKSVTFRVTSKADPAITAEHTIPFDPNTVYTGTVTRLQLWTPSSSGGQWWPTIDDVNVYAAAPVAKTITTTPTSVRLIPVEGTLGVSAQLTAAVAPAAAPQDLTWTSSNSAVVTVDADGVVTATKRYATLNDVVPATAEITVASKATPSVTAKIRIDITDTPRASELLSIVDVDGNVLSGSEEALELEKNEAAVLLARATGGDGDTDIARIEWSSADAGIVAVRQGDAPLAGTTVTGVAGGTTTVTVKVWVYSTATPLTASVTVSVPLDVPPDAAPPAQAGLSTTAGWATGLQDGNFDVKMDLWWGSNARSFRLLQDGALIATIPLTPNGLQAQHAVVPVRGLKNGTYAFTGELVNTAGTTATTAVTVKVTQASPAKPAVRVEGTGASARLLTDLWWGTNATGYRIFDGTTIIAEGALTAGTPSAQHVVTDLGQLAAGSHILVAEFYNDAGVTRSDPVTVAVG